MPEKNSPVSRRIIADLHIHSRFSRATSSRLRADYLERWARIKGVGLLGTGDCTHPRWLEELRDCLEDAEEGLFTLGPKARAAFDAGPALAEGLPDPAGAGEVPRFVLTGEISSIYKDRDRTRKVHHLVLLPDFKAAAAFQAGLERIGNILSDGRPILGISSRDLLALLLDSHDKALLIPAHIWTPWFSALGAQSGYDSIDECYGDLARFIPAVETGLSSNPPMNWALSALDRFAIISNSDAHSPDKLGREATVFDFPRGLSYQALAEALAGGSGVRETVEFFPQEGKYHYDGHRKCGFHSQGGERLCPVCGKPLTRGVMGRVLELADRPVDESAPFGASGEGPSNRRPYRSLIPLGEVLGEILETGTSSKKVAAAYGALIEKAGSELSILMDMDLKALGGLKIPGLSGELLSRALGRMRSGEVIIQGGFDGEYGVIRVFAPGETKDPKAGAGLFGALPQAPPEKEKSRKEGCPPRPSPEKPRSRGKSPATGPAPEAAFSLHRDQEAVITHDAPRALIIAGPGTGKTSTLAAKIARLIDGGQDPASILAISFTVKAAAELGERIARNVSPAPAAVPVMTFHALGCSILRDHCREAGLNPDFTILDEEARNKLLRDITGGVSRPKSLGAYIEKRKRYLLLPGEKIPQIPASASCFGPMLRESPVESEGGSLPPGPHKVAAHPPQRGGFPPATPPLDFPQAEPEMESLYAEYRNRLRSLGTLDFDDLVSGAFRLLAVKPEILRAYRKRFRTIFVDEYQDINFAQYALIRLLSSGESPKDPVEKPPDLWVIGDPNQAIYGFRGSDKAFIDRFKEDYPEASFLSLSQSFRCAQPILDAAGQLTGTVLQGIPAGGAALFRSEYPTEKSEAEGIARRIAGLIGGTGFFAIDSGAAGDLEGGASPGDCAVLVRAAVLGGPIVKALKDHGIPFEFAGEKPWWEDEDVKKVLALLRERPDQAGNPREAVRKARESAGWKSGTAMPASLERLEAFAALFGKDDGVRAFLDALSWGGGEEFSPPRQNAVRIMTMHASKGLEFEHVFAAGLEEGLLPFTLYDSPGDDKAGTPDPRDFVEEEKRLLYVAMTRAKRGLYLSWARERKFRGRTLPGGPSPFLAQLESVIPLERTERKIKRDSQPGLF